MTVLIVPSWYTAKPNAQLGAFFREQALALKKQGINVIVADATLQDRNKVFSKSNYKLVRFDDEGLDTYSYTTPSFGVMRITKLGQMLFYKNLIKIYKRMLEDGIQIDIIHAHAFYPAGFAATKLGEKYGVPVVFTEHSSDILTGKLTNSKIKCLKSSVFKADKVICVGQELKKAIWDYTGEREKFTVIPNMVDGRFIYSKSEKNNNKFVFVSIGNLIQRKRFDLTIDAFSKAFAGNSNVSLIIIGDGVLRIELEDKVKKLNIQSQVQFLGRISREQVVKQLQHSDVFVLPSDFETFGVVYIEAMACGLPVIGTRNGGADDIITKLDGCLIDKDDVIQLVESMRYLYKKYDEYDRLDISQRCKQIYGEYRVCNEIVTLYKGVLQLRKQMRDGK